MRLLLLTAIMYVCVSAGASTGALAAGTPTVTSVSPDKGPKEGGTTVTITGSELEEATSVRFGEDAAESFTVNSPESITAVTPARKFGGVDVQVSVTTPAGMSGGSVTFKYLPTPFINRVSPDNGPAAGGTTVKIESNDLEAGSTVMFGASPASSVTFHGGTEKYLTAVSPPGVGPVSVVVTTPNGGPSEGNELFDYESGAPEFGRCVGAPVSGSFTNGTCRVSTDAGRYAWLSSVQEAGFSASIGASTIETVTKAKVVCSGAVLTGEIASTETVGGVTIRFTGCVSGAHPCTSSGAGTGEVATSRLEGALGFVSESKGKVALELSPMSEPFMQYTCAGASPTTVAGSVLIPLKAGKMDTTTKLKLKAKKGKQEPEAFEGGEPDVLSSSTGSGPPEETGLTLGGTLSYEEALEINPAV
ncbi:MAG: IPT/TIG domain-containing protein [Solirubrobacteraceae bacterium]